jgi:hypothetical protein
MAKIDHDNKTVSAVCQTDDEAKVRVALQEILDDNPGYTPVLVVEDAAGKETTYTSLTDRRRRSTASSESSSEELEVEEDASEEESTDDEDEAIN